MSNLFEVPDLIASEVLTHLVDALTVTRVATREVSDLIPAGTKGGDTYRIKTRPTFRANEFAGTITVQDARESVRPFRIEKLPDVSVEIGTAEMALSLDNLSETILKPAGYALAEYVEQYVSTKILEAAGQYNSSPLMGTIADMALVSKAATEQQMARQGRFCLLNLEHEAYMKGLDFFNRADIRADAYAKNALADGFLARTGGFEFYSAIHMPTSIQVHGDGTAATNNTGGTTNLVGHSTLVCTAIVGAGGFAAGDRLQIAGVRRPLVVATAALTGATSVALVDPISELIPDGAAISVVASGLTTELKGCAFDGMGLGVVFPPLDLPPGKFASVKTMDNVSVRTVFEYDITRKTHILSCDLLVGAGMLDPRRAMLLTQTV